MAKFFFVMTMLATIVATTSFAAEFTAGSITIFDPHSFETSPRAKSASAYAMIENSGDQDDVLLGIRAEFARGMLHKSETDAQGVTSMTHQMGGISVPAGSAVMLEPGGFHMMFMGLAEPFQKDTFFPIVMVFENAGEVEVVVKIQSRSAQASKKMNHADHKMSD